MKIKGMLFLAFPFNMPCDRIKTKIFLNEILGNHFRKKGL